MKTIPLEKASYSIFVNSLLKNSRYYKTIVSPNEDEKVFDTEYYFKRDDNPKTKRSLIFLASVDLSQIRILLLALFSARDSNEMDSKTFRKAIEITTEYQTLHVLAKSSANKLTPLYRKYSTKIRNTRIIAENRKNLKNMIIDLKSISPTLESVVNETNLEYDNKISVASMNRNQKKSRSLILRILTTLSIENQFSDTNSGNDGFEFIHNATIEHIIDQSTVDNNETYKLGNLLLLERSKHIDSIDKELMYKTSDITLTKKFANKVDEFKTEEDILKRNTELLTDYFNYVTSLE